MDQRGFGRSSPVPPLFGFSGLVRDTATVLDALDLRDTVVVGHSMGGGVALGLAIDSPETVAERVAAIVLINSSGRGPADRPVTRAKVTALDLRFLERLGRHPRHGLVLARANFGPEPTRSHVNAALTIGIDSPVERRRGFARRLLGIDLTRALSRVDVPVLVLVGAADAVVPPADSRRTVALIPGARMEMFEGAGHMLPFERSEQVVEQILALAAQIEAGSG
jgi:3-oxoadipate enol-lactonase